MKFFKWFSKKKIPIESPKQLPNYEVQEVNEQIPVVQVGVVIYRKEMQALHYTVKSHPNNDSWICAHRVTGELTDYLNPYYADCQSGPTEPRVDAPTHHSFGGQFFTFVDDLGYTHSIPTNSILELEVSPVVETGEFVTYTTKRLRKIQK